MSSNVTIPEWAEKAAQDFHDKWDTGMSGAAFKDLARALLAAERRGLEKAEKLLAEGYSRDVGEAWRRDGQPSKNDKCSHGAYHYEECLPCAQAAIRSLGDKT